MHIYIVNDKTKICHESNYTYETNSKSIYITHKNHLIWCVSEYGDFAILLQLEGKLYQHSYLLALKSKAFSCNEEEL